MIALRLHQAAALLRERATADGVPDGPWEFEPFIHGDPLVCQVGRGGFGAVAMANTGTSDYGRSIAIYLATMAPPIALALADWLEAEGYLVQGATEHPELHSPLNRGRMAHLEAVTNAILGSPS